MELNEFETQLVDAIDQETSDLIECVLNEGLEQLVTFVAYNPPTEENIKTADQIVAVIDAECAAIMSVRNTRIERIFCEA